MNTFQRLPLRFVLSAVVLILTFVLAPIASAHVPIGSGGNESLASAQRISDPAKSWAIYGDLLGGGQAQYFSFQAAQGQRLHLSLLTTTDPADATFAPGMVLMGPGLASRGQLPGDVQAPAGAGWVAVAGSRPAQATFEPFGPGAYVQLADLAMEAPAAGEYVVAVQATERGGHYGLAVGDNEAFTPAEWLLSPYSLLRVYAWERENVLLALIPAAAVVALGLALLARRQRAGRRLDPAGWLAALAGLLFISTGATVLSQMLLSLIRAPADAGIIVTLNFAFLPIVLGVLALRLAGGPRRPRTRLWLVLLAGGAVALWAGYLIGPGLALAAALAPTGKPGARP